MAKIIGNTTATPNPRPDWNQTNETKADYIKNKPNINNGLGKNSITIGDGSQVIGDNSFASGENNNVLSESAHAEGKNNRAGAQGYYIIAVSYPEGIPSSSEDVKPINIYTDLSQASEIGYKDDGEFEDSTQYSRDFISEYVSGTKLAFVVGSKYYPNCIVQSVDKNKLVCTLTGQIGFNKDNFPTSDLSVDDNAIHAIDIDAIINNRLNSDKQVLSDAPVVKGFYAHAEGRQNNAIGIGSHAEGRQNDAYGDYSHVEGRYTKANYASHAEGIGTHAKAMYSHAEGYYTKSYGERSHTEGWDSTTEGLSSHAEGINTNAKGSASHTEGNNTIAYGDNSHAEGCGSKSFGENSHAEGDTNAVGKWAHAEGKGYTGFYDATQVTNGAIGDYSHAEGAYTKASGTASHAEGQNSQATGNYAHAEGDETVASGIYSHAEGRLSKAKNEAAHAEGIETKAEGQASHAEGGYTEAMFKFAHAEGGSSKALADNSHAEGWLSETHGNASHAEGYSSKALEHSAHAEGFSTEARGQASHSEGLYTVSASNYQHVQGKFNIEDTEQKYAHIVGNGDDADNRSNAHTIDWSGNAWYAGTVSAADPTEDNHVVNLKHLADNYALKQNVTNSLKGTSIGIGTSVSIEDISPNPHTIDVVIESKNLVGKPFVSGNTGTIAINGINFKVTSASIQATGTSTEGSRFILQQGVYYGDEPIASNSTNGLYATSNYVEYDPSLDGVPTLSIYIPAGKKLTNYTLRPQIEKGTKSTTYTAKKNTVEGVTLTVSETGETYTTDADGRAYIKSCYPALTLQYASGYRVCLDYQRDVNTLNSKMDKDDTQDMIDLAKAENYEKIERLQKTTKDHEIRVTSLEKIAGVLSTSFTTASHYETIPVPENSIKYAQITKICGDSSIYSNDMGIQNIIKNYPCKLITNYDVIDLSWLSSLNDFGLDKSNYVYINDGRLIYHQECRYLLKQNATENDLEEGEEIMWYLYDNINCVKLKEPIETDITDTVGFDGFINVEGATSIQIEHSHYEDDVANMHEFDGNAYQYKRGDVEAMFEIKE